MVFGNRSISEITDQDLIDLIGKQREGLNIDFKQKDYHKDSKDLNKDERELCKDVTAMANAEGGYILIGVSEENEIAQGFFTVSNPEEVAQRVRRICRNYIDPEISGLEVGLHPFQWKSKEITLVIIHVPLSEKRPHGFHSKGTNNFVRRHGDGTRVYTVAEMTKDFLLLHQSLDTDQMNRKVDTILRYIRADRRDSISPQDDALEQKEIDDLLHLMKLRFDAVTLEQPYYRILAVPKELNPNAVDTRDEDIRKIMCNPSNRRYGNFGVTGISEREMSRSSEGIEGPNVTDGEIVLLKNGFLEVQCPLSDTIQFQWKHEESGFSEQWLYPYVVCEFPVTFLRLVKEIYDASGIDSKIFIQQEYHNLSGFMLVGGSPISNTFGIRPDGRCVYESSRPIISKRSVESDFNPDHVAYDLVKDVYDSFGLDSQWIPAFDEDGNFILE